MIGKICSRGELLSSPKSQARGLSWSTLTGPPLLTFKLYVHLDAGEFEDPRSLEDHLFSSLTSERQHFVMLEHVPRNRLPAIQPFFRYAPYSCGHSNYAANHRAVGVALAQPAYRRPQRLLVMGQLTSAATQVHANRVRRQHPG